MTIEVGNKAPEFTLQDQDEAAVSLSQFAGSWVVLYFYPKDDTPGCTIEVRKVFKPEGDVDIEHLFWELIFLVIDKKPAIVNMSFAGTGSDTALFESLIKFLHRFTDIVFVGSAGNEGTCVEQFPAALPEVIAVGALSPDGPAPWSNYGPWVDACAPGTDLVSAFFAKFDGALPPINGFDSDNFVQWATWSGTSFAAPQVAAELSNGATRAQVQAP